MRTAINDLFDTMALAYLLTYDNEWGYLNRICDLLPKMADTETRNA